MGAKYSSQATSGYNSSPPADDGTQTASNLIAWATIKTKLADVLKTFGESINTALVSAFDYSVRQISLSDSTVASDHMRCVEIAPTVTTAVTVSLGDAATMTTTYRVFVKNSSAINQTVGRVTVGDTIDGAAANLPLIPGEGRLFQVKTSADGYLTICRVGVINPSICDFRLTLTTGTPVTISDVTAATTLYASPYKGNRIAIFDGANWLERASAEFSIAVPATTAQMYDVFCFDNAGVPTLELTAWTNDTTRATALVLQNGVYVKSGATTRRYLGSFRTTGVSGQTEDSFAKRYVWNYYNRVDRPMRGALETADVWTYTIATLRQANANTANQLDFVRGLDEDEAHAQITASAANTNSNVTFGVAVGLDSTSAMVSGCFNGTDTTQIANQPIHVVASWRGFPGIGRHTIVWLEISNATGTTSWIGDNGAPTSRQSGIHGGMRA